MTPDQVMEWTPAVMSVILVIAVAGALVFAGINMYHLSKSDKK